MKYTLIAGTQSGCGKTSITLAVLQFLKAKNKSVRAFKTGPDFLDPMWHKAITQKTSYNLDTNMIGIEQSQQIIQDHQDAEFGIVEGVMGLFDGRGGVGGKGSGAHLAKSLGIPVCLVIDAKGMAGSVVPLVKGFVAEAQIVGFEITGIIANRLGSENHASIIRELLVDHKLPPLIAWMEKNAPTMPERHLGLQMPEEQSVPDFSQVFHADLDLFTAALSENTMPENALGDVSLDEKQNSNPQTERYLENKKIAIARDSAACFIYQHNLDWLQNQGATLQYFSPVAGDKIPEDIDAIWLPGGYPELHTEALSQSNTWQSLAQHIDKGTPCLAECGGMMMLGEALVDHAKKHWQMAGILPIQCHMQDRLASLGYREDTATGIKGHEYHHSKRKNLQELPKAFSLSRGDEGLHHKNLRASYIHWYFSSNPKIAASFFLRESNT